MEVLAEHSTDAGIFFFIPVRMWGSETLANPMRELTGVADFSVFIGMKYK